MAPVLRTSSRNWVIEWQPYLLIMSHYPSWRTIKLSKVSEISIFLIVHLSAQEKALQKVFRAKLPWVYTRTVCYSWGCSWEATSAGQPKGKYEKKKMLVKLHSCLFYFQKFFSYIFSVLYTMGEKVKIKWFDPNLAERETQRSWMSCKTIIHV